MPHFDTHEYIKNLGEELMLAYRSAGQATTPGLKALRQDAIVSGRASRVAPSAGERIETSCRA
jgi:hypothetical protein